LTLEDVPADRPVEPQNLGVRSAGGAHLGRAHAGLELVKQLGVPVDVETLVVAGHAGAGHE
jgi:hypothetical protein